MRPHHFLLLLPLAGCMPEILPPLVTPADLGFPSTDAAATASAAAAAEDTAIIIIEEDVYAECGEGAEGAAEGGLVGQEGEGEAYPMMEGCES